MRVTEKEEEREREKEGMSSFLDVENEKFKKKRNHCNIRRITVRFFFANRIFHTVFAPYGMQYGWCV